jgi:hypothetical protein
MSKITLHKINQNNVGIPSANSVHIFHDETTGSILAKFPNGTLGVLLGDQNNGDPLLLEGNSDIYPMTGNIFVQEGIKVQDIFGTSFIEFGNTTKLQGVGIEIQDYNSLNNDYRKILLNQSELKFSSFLNDSFLIKENSFIFSSSTSEIKSSIIDIDTLSFDKTFKIDFNPNSASISLKDIVDLDIDSEILFLQNGNLEISSKKNIEINKNGITRFGIYENTTIFYSPTSINLLELKETTIGVNLPNSPVGIDIGDIYTQTLTEIGLAGTDRVLLIKS